MGWPPTGTSSNWSVSWRRRIPATTPFPGRSSSTWPPTPLTGDEVAWWRTDDFWQYALYAAVAYIRAAANRADVPVAQACRELSQREATLPGYLR